MEEQQIRAALDQLDGTVASALILLTGLTLEQIRELGGLPDEQST